MDLNDPDESHDEELGRLHENSNRTESEDQNDVPWWSEKPMIVYFSESMRHHDGNTCEETSLEQDDISAIDGEDTHEISFINEKSQDDASCEKGKDAVEGTRGSVTGEIEGQSFDCDPDVEREHGVHGNGESKDEDGHEDIDNDIICNIDSMDSDLDGGDQIPTGEKQEGKDEASTTNQSVASEPVDKPDASAKTKDDTPTIIPRTVPLAPKIISRLSTDEDENKSQEENQRKSPSDTVLDPNNGPDTPPLTIGPQSPKNYLSPRSSLIETNTEPSAPKILSIPNLSDEDSDDKGDGICANANSIFRGNGIDEDAQSIPEIQACGSSETEVTSNVDGLKEVGSSFDHTKLENLLTTSAIDTAATGLSPPYQLETVNSGLSTLSGLGRSIPMKKVESYKSTDAKSLSSNISYFSYEDISIASEESEMCAICLCPYEEGDIRIFSKRCSHAFHKECILEWLVKSHNECPCCRIDMVTKSEIEETSASLIGTERLAQALAVVNVSGMREAPPFRGRRPRQLAHQILARARAQRRRSGQAQESADSPLMSPQSPNAHWLWSARFDNLPSAAGSSSMPPLDEGDSQPPSPPTPRSNNGFSNTNNNWLWATRFAGSVSADPQSRIINPSRSSDAIMNPHETNQSVAAPVREAHMHNTTAGSLFSSNTSMYHNHWQQRRVPPRRSISQTITLSPTRRHTHWRQNPPTELPVTVLPTI